MEAGTSGGSDPAGDQVGPVVAKVTTGGTWVWGRTGRHGQGLASARERQVDWTASEEIWGCRCWDLATGEASTGMWPFSARGLGHHSVPVGSSVGQQGSPPGKFKEMDRERRPCVLVTDRNPVLRCGALGAWASPSWPAVHSCRHCALALSSSLCTVLYSTWKCWWGTQRVRTRAQPSAPPATPHSSSPGRPCTPCQGMPQCTQQAAGRRWLA